MEEEGGDDSEMIDAMDGWDSDQDDAQTSENKSGTTTGTAGASASGGPQKIIAD